MKATTVLLLIFSCSGRPGNTVAQNQGSQNKNDDFQLFWSQFRESILSTDTSRIISLTKFPIETRGPLDSDSTIFYKREDFITIFNKFLKSHSGSINFNETESDVIQKTAIVNSSDQLTRRVGDMIFGKVEGHWKLVFIFTEPED